MNTGNIIQLRQSHRMNKSSWAWSTHVGSASIKSVLIAITESADNETLTASPSVSRLCEMTEINRKTVISSLSALVNMGLIEDTGNRAGATKQVIVYRLMVGNKCKQGNLQPDKSGYIYTVTNPHTGLLKIGKSTNPSDRFKIFSVKLPFDIEPEIKFKCSDYSSAEESLHDYFSHSRVNGEWFDLSAEDIALISDGSFLVSLGIEVTHP